MPITISELARLAGVSNATISLALNNKHAGRVSEARHKQIVALAEKYGYRTNEMARGLVQGRSYRIGLGIEGTLAQHAIIGQFSLYERLGLFAEDIHKQGYSIEIIQLDKENMAEQFSRRLNQHNMDGLIFIAWPARILEQVLFSLKVQGIAAVASGTALEDLSLTWTDVNRSAVFEEATQRLVDEGHTEIGFLNIDPGIHSQLKINGFLRVMKRQLGINATAYVTTPQEFSVNGVVDATTSLLKSHPKLSAILMADNYYGDVIIYALKLNNKEPFSNIRLIGFGDTVLADRCHPRLSHYSLGIKDQVRFAVDALLDQIQNPSTYQPRQQNLLGTYIQRET